MILITGANGHLGSLTIESLQKSNPEMDIAALVRSKEKGADLKEKGIDIRIGDYFDPDSLDNAFDGIDTLLLISSSTIEDRVQQHKNVITSAKKAGISHLFYTSMVQAEKELSPLAIDHHQTEQAIKASGMDHTIFRNTFYTEFFPMFLGQALETGNWMYPVTQVALPSGFEQLNKPTTALEFTPQQVAAQRQAWISEWQRAVSR